MRSNSLLILFLIAGIGLAQRNAKVPDPDPEKERKTFKLPKGFEVNLFAADPLLAKPIQMNFDPEGRLWIASSETYPHVLPKKKANDKILILEDTNGDGKADKTTVFADKLLIPTGLAPGDGGVYVANSTELLHLSDTDGDGKADKRRVMLSGFGTEDTHHLLHTLRWGFDGALYMNQSIYIHSHIETPHGVRRLNGGGIWRYRPASCELSVFARGWVNAWGHHFDRFGQSFVTDGAGGEGINFVVPGASYPTAVGARRILHGLNPGSPKYCGEEVISGRHLPPEWRGNIITNDFRAHRVCRFVIKEDGSGFSAQQMPDLIKSSHPAFRPIDVKMGPDGAIYIADWYNPIIQHGEVDFRDPRRDHVHGRIWRITVKDRKLVERPKLRKAKAEELFQQLLSPELWTREQARRVLQERGQSVLPSLTKWVASIDRNKPEHEEALLQGLWMHQALRSIQPKLLNEVLRANDGRIRAAGTRVIAEWWPKLGNPLELLANLVRDEHPRVRLEAVRILGQIRKPESISIALWALDRPVDHFLEYAMWLCTRELQSVWLPALQSGKLVFRGNASHLTYALKAVGSPQVVRPLVQLIEKNKVPPRQRAAVLRLIASQGGRRDLRLILDRILKKNTSPDEIVNLLGGLQTAALERNMRPEGPLQKIETLLASKDDRVLDGTLRLIGLWKLEALRPKVESHLSRVAAMDALVSLGGEKSLEKLSSINNVDAITALARLDVKMAASRATSLLKSPLKPEAIQQLIQSLLRQRRGSESLLQALKEKISSDNARIALRTIRATGRKEAKLIDAVMKAGSLKNQRKLTETERNQWIADVTRLGDAARGEVVFRRASLSCLKCHAIAGAGGRVGPDLISIGASAPVDYLLDSLLLPNKAIKENYHSLIVETSKGRVHTGIKIREANKELILRTAEDQEIRIPTKEIESKRQGTSLMPEGLTDSLTRQEVLDLTRFLSELGKVGPYQVTPERVVRRWRALTPSSQVTYQLRRQGFATVARAGAWQNWESAYSQVSGALPLQSLPQVKARLPFVKELVPLTILRAELEVSTPGKVQLKINETKGLSLYLNGDPVEVKKMTSISLQSGRSQLTFIVRMDQRTAPLRVGLSEAKGSKAQARIVTGK